MYGQLSDLLGSGVPLLRALKSLVKSTVNKRLADVLREIHNEVADGKSLHESMAGHQEIFPTLHTVMVQAGERASFLEEVLSSLSVSLERLDDLRSKVLGALVYPTMLVVMGSLGDDRRADFLRTQVRADAGRRGQAAANRGRLFHERNVAQPLADSHCRAGRGDRFFGASSKARPANRRSSVGDSRFPWRATR